MYLSPIFRDKIPVKWAEVITKSRLSKNQWDLTVSKSSFFLLSLSLILKINDRSLSVNPIEESMRVNCKERLSKNQFDLTVRKDERFLLSLSLLLSIPSWSWSFSSPLDSFSCKHSLFILLHSITCPYLFTVKDLRFVFTLSAFSFSCLFWHSVSSERGFLRLTSDFWTARGRSRY